MVIRKAVSAHLTCLALMAVAVSAAIAETPRAASKITFTANGARSDNVTGEETRSDCASFRLTARDVRIYFSTAGQVDSRAHNHDLDMSRCHAAGFIRFTDGRSGHWAIDRARRGSLLLSDGRQIYFYCVDCRSKQFFELDDEERETGRLMIRTYRPEGVAPNNSR